MTDSADSSAPGGDVEAVRGGYAFAGPVIELGALVVDGSGTAAARPDVAVRMPLSMLTRHGLVSGATGTGKTKTLQLMAEQLSALGVPVFLADVKGDVSGVATPGVIDERVTARAAEVGQDWVPAACPAEFFALGGEGTGVPIRASVTSFGPVLLAKVLGLNAVQESSLGLVFHVADSAGLPLLDLADLRAVLAHLTSPAGKALLEGVGGLSKATVGVILRELVAFADEGAEAFFGEPELDPLEFLRTAPDGRGVLSVLDLPRLQDRPAVFSTFLVWLLAELFEQLPEVGDLPRPKLVFFLDEAHLLFADASKDFLNALTRTVRLIRSKGVGVIFVTQTPKDVAPDVLAQLGNRVQHALRAYTPADAKALRAAVSTFPRSGYDLEELLTQLGTGEAVVTVLSERGVPTPVAWTRMRAPQSLMAPSSQAVRDAIVAASPLQAEYGTRLDRDSAYERLAARLAAPVPAPGDDADVRRSPEPRRPRSSGDLRDQPEGPVTGGADGVGGVLAGKALESFASSAARALGREIGRSIFGTARRRRR